MSQRLGNFGLVSLLIPNHIWSIMAGRNTSWNLEGTKETRDSLIVEPLTANRTVLTLWLWLLVSVKLYI